MTLLGFALGHIRRLEVIPREPLDQIPKQPHVVVMFVLYEFVDKEFPRTDTDHLSRAVSQRDENGCRTST